MWWGVALALALFPRFRCVRRLVKFVFLQTGNAIFFLQFHPTVWTLWTSFIMVLTHSFIRLCLHPRKSNLSVINAWSWVQCSILPLSSLIYRWIFRAKIFWTNQSRAMASANLGKRCKSHFKELTLPWRPGEGTWVFFGWVCAARDSKLIPRSKKNFPLNWYPALKMGQFFIPRSRIRPKTDTTF